MEQADGDGHGVQAHLGQEASDREWMGEVGLSGEAHLALVDARGVHVRPMQNAEICVRQILLHQIYDLVDSRHSNGSAQSRPKRLRWDSTTRCRRTREAPTTCLRSSTAASISPFTIR